MATFVVTYIISYFHGNVKVFYENCEKEKGCCKSKQQPVFILFYIAHISVKSMLLRSIWSNSFNASSDDVRLITPSFMIEANSFG